MDSFIVSVDVGNGIFDFVEDVGERAMLENAWAAINETESWNYMQREQPKGYMFSTDNQINIIFKKMVEINPTIGKNHSGGSMAGVMRNMQYIAANGIDQFKLLMSR